jgi:hypothetical protein
MTDTPLLPTQKANMQLSSKATLTQITMRGIDYICQTAETLEPGSYELHCFEPHNSQPYFTVQRVSPTPDIVAQKLQKACDAYEFYLHKAHEEAERLRVALEKCRSCLVPGEAPMSGIDASSFVRRAVALADDALSGISGEEKAE